MNINNDENGILEWGNFLNSGRIGCIQNAYGIL